MENSLGSPLDTSRSVGTPSPWTHNVIYGLIATALYGLGPGLYQNTVLPSFCLIVGGNNFDVGFAEGLQGTANMISALPAGYLADKWSRKACIRLGCCLQIFGSLCLLFSVFVAHQHSIQAFILLCVALCFQGVCDGIINGPLLALMDDSCPAGRRSDVETANTILGLVSASVGPLLGLIVFLVKDNHWELDSMKWVISIGVVMGLLSLPPAWRMDDNKALGEHSEAVHLQARLRTGAENDEGEVRELRLRESRATCFGLVTTRRVRFIFFIGELLLSLGAGMTVKFFPVFFDIECHEDPATVQVMFASLFLVTALGTSLANKLAKHFGRMQVVVPCFMIGVCCTILLGSLKPFYQYPGVMVPIFMLRCSIMWSCGALKGSVIADYTPKSSRGRWKALESITAFGWSGSAAVGGWLIDRVGYGLTFVVTGSFQAIVIPLWCMLLPLVAKESELLRASEAADTVDGGPHSINSTSGISLPYVQQEG